MGLFETAKPSKADEMLTFPKLACFDSESIVVGSASNVIELILHHRLQSVLEIG